MKRAVVFDMDGVLFDTESLCSRGWLEIGKKYGLHDIETVSSSCIGFNAADTKDFTCRYYGELMPPDRYDSFRDEVRAWSGDYIEKHGLPIKAGAREILEYLEKQGVMLALASSTRSVTVLSHLRESGLEQYFQVVVGGDMVEHSKPWPDIYLMACHKLGVEPNQAYAIEDSPNGIRAAAAAGLSPVMVPDLISPDEEMRSLCHWIEESLISLMERWKCEK